MLRIMGPEKSAWVCNTSSYQHRGHFLQSPISHQVCLSWREWPSKKAQLKAQSPTPSLKEFYRSMNGGLLGIIFQEDVSI